ncbi:PAS domain S-box protein [Robbsia sp. Bb-Pol-6]|uniref:histidine kinase n=1 Tax=Robbsia betulipollinis TaxID=2981849 RepID=A0ABT3ZNC7_9BURK|nr:PAS domain S-box protein [Robbsia betulipollinis]MCY0388021.1 PAS domain S-box protein [Robbsia betulipollinis]
MTKDRPAEDGAPAASLVFLSGAGKIGALIEAFDWSRTPLGPLATWPGYLKTTVAVLLRSPVPIVTLWGEEGIMIYNERYSAFAGDRHPHLLGSRVREGWPEVADFNDHVMQVGLAGGTLAYRDQELTLERNGAPEPVWMNLDYSPVIDDAGRPAGVISIVVETTAKVRAERYLSGERERLQRMFEQAPGFMAMLTGPQHVFELVNPAYMRLIGQRQVLGHTAREVLPEISGQELGDRFDAIYASGEAFSANSLPVLLQRQPHAAPERRYVDVVYQPVRGGDGTIIGIFVQGTDVTDRVLAEQALEASENTFRTLAQAMPNQVWAAPADGRLDWFNARAYEYCGATHATLAGQGWQNRIHPEDVAQATRRWAQATRDGTPYENEMRIRRADGAFRWHLSRAFAVRDEHGIIVRWIGTNTDIENQKAVTETLSRHNETLEHQVATRTADRDRIWRLSTDVMLVAEFDGTIVTVNPAWTHLLGWTEAELLGRPFIALVHPDDRDAALAELTALSRGARTLRFENRYQRKDGGYSTLSWAAVPDAQRLHAVGRDVTADRAAAAALRRTEAALYQSQKMETIGKLTGGVAHDFNNLLQVISGNLQLLAFDVKGQPQAEQRVSNALAGVKRGAKLASHLLAFGRRQALEPKSLKIGRLVSGMEDMLRRSLGETIEIEMVIPAGLWSTLVDPAHVENAILNLSINARDAMDGVGRLTIEVGNAYLDHEYARDHAELKPGQYVLLAVTDTGSGMPADVIAQAFEPFFSTKPEGKGTGLGLSMVYGFVKQSGGHVAIYSEPGHGTTVRIYLPRTLQDEDRVEPVDALPVVGGVETILMAEDDAAVRATVMDMLTGLGYRVLKANDASSALAIIDSGAPIDLLFTDVVMPGPLRSPELARKARERLPDLAVLFTSGYTENAIVHGGRLDPGVELLGKPYTREALARKIRHVMANRKQRLQQPATPAAQAPSAPDSPHANAPSERNADRSADRSAS